MAGAVFAAWPLTDRDSEVDEVLAALADPDRTAVVLHGPAGVGKTRLAETCLTLAESSGRLVARATASSSSAQLPLGTLASILPATLHPEAAPAAIFSQARDELLAIGGDERLVLLVDDAHLLDTSSALLLTQLLDARAVFVLATIRDGEAVSDAVGGWWRRASTLRLDLADLDHDATAEVLATVLGGVVATDTVRHLQRASGGNPLLLRELLTQAREGGQLSKATGTWRLSGQIHASRRLTELVAPRLADLDRHSRDVLDQLSVCAPLGVEELTGDVTADSLEPLESGGLIKVVVDGQRHQLQLGHPLIGEVLRTELSVLRRRAVLLATAARVESFGARRREDTRRIATWRLDAGASTDRALLVQAARFARYAHDFGEVERLGTILWEQERTAEVAVLLGEAHYELGHFDAAEAVLAAPLPSDSSGDLLVQRAMLRATSLQFGRSDWRAALSVIEEARAALGPEHQTDLLFQEGQLWNSVTDPIRALEVIERIQPQTARDRVLLSLVRGIALSRRGWTSEAIDVSAEGYREHIALDEPIALASPGIHFVTQVSALSAAGRFAESDELVQLGYDGAVADNIPFGQIYLALMAANSCFNQGRIGDAQRWYEQAASTAQADGFHRAERTARAGIAGTEALMGNNEAAATAAAQALSLPQEVGLRFQEFRGLAWAAWLAGDLEQARGLLVDSATDATNLANVSSAAYLWHDAARLGVPDVAGHLATLETMGDSPVVVALAAHVTALEADDPDALAAAAEVFEALGMRLLAAEAATSAAGACDRHGFRRQAAAWTTRARALAERCPGVQTPGLLSHQASARLTVREREIAHLAGRGFTSHEIAEKLFISVRTVNNHLGNVYAKVGISSRSELADALELT